MFRINFSDCNGIFGVPNEVVDKHLKLSGALTLKVLLVLLRHGRPMEVKELAEILNQSEGDIKDALNQWVQADLVSEVAQNKTSEKVNLAPKKAPQPALTIVENNNFEKAVEQETSYQFEMESVIEEEPMPVAPEPEIQEKKKKRVLKERFSRMTQHDVNEVSMADENVGILIQEAQNVLGRPLFSRESETIVSLYHVYGMQLDIIIMMLSYCKAQGNDRPAYYEKMAVDWINKSIDSHEKAEAELMRLSESKDTEREIRRVFGIYDRRLSKKEQDYYSTWRYDYGYNEEMIKMACDRNIDAIGNVSFPYIDAIMKSWFEKGIKTPNQVDGEEKTEPKPVRQKSNYDKEIRSSFNIYDRQPTGKEQSMYACWRDELGFDQDMIFHAVEISLTYINEASFSYVDSVLRSWHEKGIKTQEQVQQAESTDKKAGRRKVAGGEDASYDLNSLEEMLNKGSVWD